MKKRRPLRDRVEFGLLLSLQSLDRLMGPGLSGRIAAGLGRLVYRPLRIRAGVVDEQLRHAFPDRDEAWRRDVALQSYAHLGREAMTILRLSRLGPADVVAATEPHGLEELDEGLKSGKGAVIVTGHFGNWEVAGAFLAARGYPLDVVAVKQRNRLVDRHMREMRERLGMRVIYRGGATRTLLASLQNGRSVALVADQDARSRGVFVPFFGRLASTYRGPALLALRTGAPLYVGFAIRRPDGGYHGEIRRVHVPEGGLDQVDELTARLTATLEEAVRRAPGQYLWQHRRWKTRAPERDGGAVGYDRNGSTRAASGEGTS